MAVAVDQPRDQDVFVQLVVFASLVGFLRQLRTREKIDNFAVVDSDAVILENRVLRDNGNHPAGRNECVDGLGHGRCG